MDAATVIVMLAVHLLCSGALLVVVSRRMPQRRGMLTWAAALALFGAAYAGRLASDMRAPSVWGLPTDVAMIAALLLFERGLREFFGRAPRAAVPLLLVAIYAVLHVAVAAAGGMVARFVELNLVIGSAYLWLAVCAWRERERLEATDELRQPLIVLTVMLFTVGSLSWARAAVILESGLGSMYRGLFAQVFFGVASIVAVMVALVLLWMVFIRLNRQLAELATRDSLTRVLNRNGLEDALTRHFGARPVTPLTLLLVDIDHFKAINDEHGHEAGDAVLRTVAGTLVAQLRGADFVARVGGEEFVVGCSGAAHADAAGLAERLRVSVAALELVPASGTGVVRCTVSIGVSHPAETHAACETAMRAADRALYAAKAAGRNRVEAFAPA